MHLIGILVPNPLEMVKAGRLALIDTGLYDVDRYREYARGVAQRFGLRHEELEGSTALLQKMVNGPWDDEFVVVRPGEEIRYTQFTRMEEPHEL